MGKLDQAIEQYKIALKINPDFNLARYNLGLALAKKGDYEAQLSNTGFIWARPWMKLIFVRIWHCN